MPNVLTIAGFDPSSGAGVSADLMVFAAHRLFGTACITALTVQNTLGVTATQALSVDSITSTLDCLYADLPPAGVKIGMLATAEIASAVAAFIQRVRRLAPVIVVLDPVIRSSSGRELLEPRGINALRSQLLPHVDWVTPNVDELGLLLGREAPSTEDLPNAAAELQGFGDHLNVVVTSGHLNPPDDLLLQSGSASEILAGERIESSSTHGTGCAFSTALLSRLVMGDDPRAAAQRAKDYVAEAMRSASPIGHGNGPLNHLWPLLTRS